MSDMSMLINGLKVTAEKGAFFERRNPLDGTVATRAPAASPADALMAAEAAAEAGDTPKQTKSLGERLRGAAKSIRGSQKNQEGGGAKNKASKPARGAQKKSTTPRKAGGS